MGFGLTELEKSWLRKQAAQPDTEEIPIWRFHWRQVDATNGPVTIGTDVEFFNETRGTVGRWVTNMREGGKMEEGYAVVFKRLYHIVFPDSDVVVGGLGALNSVLQASKALLQGFEVEFGVIDKDYGEAHSVFIPSGTGLTGMLGSTAVAGPAIDTGGWMSNGMQMLSNFFPISMLLAPRAGFSVTAFPKPGGVVVPQPAKMWHGFVLAGPGVRVKQ